MVQSKEDIVAKSKTHRGLTTIIFFLYMIVIFYFVLISERYGRVSGSVTDRTNFVLFQEIKRFWNYRDVLSTEAFITNLLGNIFAFSPFGFLLPQIKKKKVGIIRVIISTFLFSFVIESCQFILEVGVFDIDDLFLNTIGGIIGYMMYRIVKR
jgi:glycopeptide antibiotics resistance protein